MDHQAKAKKQQKLQRLKWDLEEQQLAKESSDQQAQLKRQQDRADLIEQRIQEAMAKGEFDNLPGKGKPLPFVTNPYLDPAQELAFGLLQNNNMAPEWIERDKEIRQALDTARQRIKQAWQVYNTPTRDEAQWQAALTYFEEILRKINRQIDDFNLIVPLDSAQRPRLRLEQELKRIQQ